MAYPADTPTPVEAARDAAQDRLEEQAARDAGTFVPVPQTPCDDPWQTGATWAPEPF